VRGHSVVGVGSGNRNDIRRIEVAGDAREAVSRDPIVSSNAHRDNTLGTRNIDAVSESEAGRLAGVAAVAIVGNADIYAAPALLDQVVEGLHSIADEGLSIASCFVNAGVP